MFFGFSFSISFYFISFYLPPCPPVERELGGDLLILWQTAIALNFL